MSREYRSDSQVKKHLAAHSSAEHLRPAHERQESRKFELAEHRLGKAKLGKRAPFKGTRAK